MINIPFGNLSKQYKKYKLEIDNAVHTVLDSGHFILGENVKKFESEFSNYCGVKYGIGVGSGTEALHLALVACGVGSGDEVITVANTAIPTISAISFAGATPVFVDIDVNSFNINENLIEEKITGRTKAILPVHLYGNPCEIDIILNIAHKYGLKVIEDCAQSHGAKFKGKVVGSFGDIGCFSFYPSKNLGAYGDGGICVTDSKGLNDKLRLLRNYGQEKRYYSIIKGFNSRLDEIQASILRVKLKRLDNWNKTRISIAKKYNKNFLDLALSCPQANSDSSHVFHLYVIRVKNRKKFMDYLKIKGINTLIHYPIPIHLQPSYKELKIKEGNLPITENVSKEIVSIPIYPELEEKEIEHIVKKVKEYFE